MPIIDASWVAKSGVAMTWAQQLDEPEPDADAEQRHEDRQTHREQRSERDQQDHDGGEDADELGRSEAAELLEHAPAERDPHALPGGVVGQAADVGDGGVGDLRRPCGRTAPSRTRRRRRARAAGNPRRRTGSPPTSRAGPPPRRRTAPPCALHGRVRDAAGRRRRRSGPRHPPGPGSATRRRSVARCDSVPERGSPARTWRRRSTRWQLMPISATIHRTTTRRRRR